MRIHDGIVSAGSSILVRGSHVSRRFWAGLSALQLRGDASNYERNPLRFTWQTRARDASRPGFWNRLEIGERRKSTSGGYERTPWKHGVRGNRDFAKDLTSDLPVKPPRIVLLQRSRFSPFLCLPLPSSALSSSLPVLTFQIVKSHVTPMT